jgi:hypothetical protein
MKDFKFFKGTLDMIDGDVRATASFNDDTPEGHVNRRMLYHTNRNLQDRLLDNVRREMPRGRLGTPERHQDILRRLQMTNDSRDLNDNPIRLFQTTTVTTVNPNWRTKIKMGLQEMSIFFKSSPYGIMLIWALSTIGVILFISKLLNAW